MRAMTVGISCAVLSSPALAQTEDDWDITENPPAQTIAATVTYATGDTLMVTCRHTTLDLFLATRDPALLGRSAEMQFDDGDPEFQTWFETPSAALVMSGLPGPNARRLRTSRRLTIVFRPTTESQDASQRHVLDLPTTANGIDRVLDACSQPRTDPRDSLSRWDNSDVAAPDYGWARRPLPEFPAPAQRAGIESGFVSYSCVVGPGGEARDCRIEKESDPASGFGAAALAALRSARVKLSGEQAAIEGQLFSAITRFRLQ